MTIDNESKRKISVVSSIVGTVVAMKAHTTTKIAKEVNHIDVDDAFVVMLYR